MSIQWPAHKCGMYLSHNRHRDYYETARTAIISGTYDLENFIDPEDHQLCIKNDEVWELQWYPNTPVGSFIICGSSLEKVLNAVKYFKDRTPLDDEEMEGDSE